MSSKTNISIVIPVYNEEGNIVPLVESVEKLRKKQKWNCEIVIVDDNSKDNTAKLSDKLSKKYKKIRVIRKKGNQGMGNTLIRGTKEAKGDIIVWIMGDRSDDLNTIPKMIKKIENGADVVFGSRYIPGGSSGDIDKFKAIASSGYTTFARVVFGIGVHDITNAFRAFRKEVFNKIKLDSGDFAISPEFAIKAHLKRFKLSEVPTTYSDRVSGQTKFNMFKMGIRYLSLVKYKFKN